MKVSEWLAQEWARQFGPALSSMTGEAVQAAAGAIETEPPAGELLHVGRRLREAPEAAFRLAFSQELWRKAGEAVLRGADLPADEESAVRDAFQEVVQQSLGQLAVSLGRRLGREVSWEEAGSEEEAEGGTGWAVVEVSAGGEIWGRAWISAGPGFVLDAAGQGREEQAAAGEIDEPPAEATGRRPMLDLLMEVELPVAVTFGRTQLRLKDAIKLTSGSIVELNRSIIEPVEVIVNNCVIARGEVVVVEGNYGVRIHEIVSREERLRTLF
jgi:flagellar motor switch protein FliN/FliY